MYRILFLVFTAFSRAEIEDSSVIVEKVFAQILSVTKIVMLHEDDTTMDDHVHFYLYKKSNPSRFLRLNINPDNHRDCRHLNPEMMTTFLIHGWGDHKDRNIIVQMRKAILEKIESNVVVVEWKVLAEQIYFHAALSAVDVGVQVGKFLGILMKYCNLSADKIHLIGHSLGGQISGIAGNVVNGTIGRVTGLDPAGPLYEFLYVEGPMVGLNQTSAKFVDVIHSAIEDFGISEPVGHADFYPNSGLIPQPGCTAFFTAGSCSHIRSVKFFIESIFEPENFIGVHCNTNWDWELFEACDKNNTAIMGYHTSTLSRGIYYLRTTSEPPFGLGNDGI